MKLKSIPTLLLLLLIFGCTKRNLVYFSDIDPGSGYSVQISETIEPTIKPDDLLNVTVSSLSAESNLLFNAGILNTLGQGGSATGGITPLNSGYLVDRNGEINFPVLGKVKLSGFSKSEAIEEMTLLLREYVKDPIVNIRFMNFKITVIGEVNNPSTFTVPTEKVNILEALGLAGDMTMFGKRENVLIVREKDGVRNAVRVNLNDKNILSSPYFMLHQNDVVYVEPDKMRAVEAGTNRRSMTFLGITASIVSAVLLSLRFWFR